MEAKDTVMDAKGITEAINRVYPSGTGTYQVNVADRAIAKAQAEISFKAGYEKGGLDSSNDFAEGKRTGIREVVKVVQEMVRLLGKVVPANQNAMIEWAVKSQDSVYTNAGATYFIGQAKLKEWGVEWARTGLT